MLAVNVESLSLAVYGVSCKNSWRMYFKPRTQKYCNDNVENVIENAGYIFIKVIDKWT